MPSIEFEAGKIAIEACGQKMLLPSLDSVLELEEALTLFLAYHHPNRSPYEE